MRSRVNWGKSTKTTRIGGGGRAVLMYPSRRAPQCVQLLAWVPLLRAHFSAANSPQRACLPEWTVRSLSGPAAELGLLFGLGAARCRGGIHAWVWRWEMPTQRGVTRRVPWGTTDAKRYPFLRQADPSVPSGRAEGTVSPA